MDKLIDRALAALAQAGADRGQCWVSESDVTRLDMETGELTSMHTAFNRSIYMRALVGHREGAVQINCPDEIEQSARQAVELALASPEDEAHDIALLEEGPSHFEQGQAHCDREGMTERFEELLDGVRTQYPDIRLVDGGCAFSNSRSMVGNTRGVRLFSRRGVYSYAVTFGADNGAGSSTSMNYTGAQTLSLDRPFLELGGGALLLEQMMLEKTGAKAVGAKFSGDVVLLPFVVCDLLYSYLQCFLSDGALIGGTSLFRERLGQRIASEQVTLVSNPFDPSLCGARLTGDGHRARDMTILQEGELKSFVLSQYGARKTGQARSGNGGEHLSLRPGALSLEQLIGNVEKGLLVGRFSGGRPNDAGDITGVAKNSFLIEKGQVVGPVRETMLAGNLAEMLTHAAGISQETLSDGSRVNPWLRLTGVTISG